MHILDIARSMSLRTSSRNIIVRAQLIFFPKYRCKLTIPIPSGPVSEADFLPLAQMHRLAGTILEYGYNTYGSKLIHVADRGSNDSSHGVLPDTSVEHMFCDYHHISYNDTLSGNTTASRLRRSAKLKTWRRSSSINWPVRDRKMRRCYGDPV